MEGTSSQPDCSIGLHLNDVCHKKTFIREAGLKVVTEFSEEDRKLISWRCGFHIPDESCVCFHHEQVYLSRYASQQRFCCDPFRCHKKRIQSKFAYYVNHC